MTYDVTTAHLRRPLSMRQVSVVDSPMPGAGTGACQPLLQRLHLDVTQGANQAKHLRHGHPRPPGGLALHRAHHVGRAGL